MDFPVGGRVKGRAYARSRSDAVRALEAVVGREIESGGRAGMGLGEVGARTAYGTGALRGPKGPRLDGGTELLRARVQRALGYGQGS